jgi:hypothetical protein
VFSNLLPGNNNNKERVVYNFSDKTEADMRPLTYTFNNAKLHDMICGIKTFSNDKDSVLDSILDIFNKS